MQIQRFLETSIEQRLGSNKVLLLYGTRRVGKTFLIRHLLSEQKEKYLLLNGEDLDTQRLLSQRTKSAYNRFLKGVKLLIIDEAQATPNIGQALKLMIDEFPQLTIIATGSSAFDLSNKTGEPLTGRSYEYKLYPIAQMELSEIESPIETVQHLDERMVLGSYPEIFSLVTHDEKAEYIQQLVRNYLLKDILAYENLRSSNKILDLLQMLAYQCGNEVSVEELGSKLQLSKNTVDKYLDLLAKVQIIYKLRGFSRNLRKEIVKNSKIYFLDNGIRNALINDFRSISVRNDVGSLWENYLIAERIKRNYYQKKNAEYYFWRTYDNQEIDLIEVTGTKISAYEFKWNKTNVKAPKAFREAYPKAKFEVITQQNYLDFIL
ncbi:MAG: ATP-binding protein [Bacteroidia bacterium]